MFELTELDFDEIMQRDIDDARVSTELIPYLLNTETQGAVKFFPPIVVVVLPVKDKSEKPSKRYPKVNWLSVKPPDREDTFQYIQSGETGEEAFRFEYPVVEGKAFFHDLARLRLNTDKVRLVIIDGQHRAMALLALYRNLKNEWTDKRRAPFEPYYRMWTERRLGNIDLSEVRLPVIVCAFPDLDEEYQGDLTVIKAARRLFITLNKEARKVSRSRNILLNDQDLISHFLRSTLDTIKKKEIDDTSALRIWNVELDQHQDRVKIESPIACTGVPHVFYAIEHVMFDQNDIKGISARLGRFAMRGGANKIRLLIDRLNGEELLGDQGAQDIRRDNYDQGAADVLAAEFDKRYGKYLISGFERFKPFEFHSRAALDVEAKLQANVNGQIRTILFDGQNIGRTFNEYRSFMTKKERELKSVSQDLPPAEQAILKQLNATNTAKETTVEEFLQLRVVRYIEGGIVRERSELKTEGDKYSPKVREPITYLYENIFKSVAFQAALYCGFFVVVEKAEDRAKSAGGPPIDRDKVFEDYLKALNAFFVPNTVTRLRNLIGLFWTHEVEGNKADDWKQVPTTTTFSTVVSRGEMKPDEWPKYRLPLLEVWRPTDPVVAGVRNQELQFCRTQSFSSLYWKLRGDFCKQNRKSPEDLTPADKEVIFQQAYVTFDAFLAKFGHAKPDRLSEKQARDARDEEPLEKAEEQLGETAVTGDDDSGSAAATAEASEATE